MKSRKEKLFADGLNTDNDFPLGNGVDEIDVVDAFFLVLVPLVNGVDTNPAGLALRVRATTSADGDMDGFGSGERLGPTFVFFGPP